MATICKTIVIGTSGNQLLSENCCGCPTSLAGCTLTTSPPSISHKMGITDLLDFSSTQYIVPIKVICGCADYLDLANSGLYKINKVHSIRVIGSNPANVSFVYCNGQTFSHTTPNPIWGGVTYSQTLNGLCMIVDKDPANIETPKASITTVGIKKCPTDNEVISTIKTELFFNDNFGKTSVAGCNSTSGISTPPHLSIGIGGLFTMQGISGNDYYKGNCSEDMGTYHRVPVVYVSGCTLSGFGNNQPLKTIQSIVINSVSDSWPVTVSYSGSRGLWFFNIPKNINGTIHTGSFLDIDVGVLTENLTCGVGFSNLPIIQTINLTAMPTWISSLNIC